MCSASPCPLLIVWVFTEQNDSNKKNHNYRREKKPGKQEPYLKQEVTNSSLQRSRQSVPKARIFARTACPKWKLPRQPRNHDPFPLPRPEPVYRSLTFFSDTPAPSKLVKYPPKGRPAGRCGLQRSRAGIHTVPLNLIENSQRKREM